MKKMVIVMTSMFMICANVLTCAAETWRYEEAISSTLTISAEVYEPEAIELPSLICYPIDFENYETVELLEGLGTAEEYALARNHSSFQFENQSGHLVYSALMFSNIEINMDSTLEFLSVDVLKENINRYLNRLGIDGLYYSEINGMHKSDYNALYESGRAEHMADLSDGITKMGATEWYDWANDDVCYMCRIMQTYNDVAIYPRIVLQQILWADNAVSYEYGTMIEIYMYESGIGRVDIANAYSFSPQSDHAPVLSFHEAIQSYKQKGNEVLSLNKQVVRNIGLYYLVQYENGVYIACPCWIFEIVHTDSMSGVEMTFREVLDARTGEWK